MSDEKQNALPGHKVDLTGATTFRPGELVGREMDAAQAIGEELETEYRSFYMRAKNGDKRALRAMGMLLLGRSEQAYVATLFHCVGLDAPGFHRKSYNHITNSTVSALTTLEADGVIAWCEGILFNEVYAPPPEALFDLGANLWRDTIGPSPKIFPFPEEVDGHEDRKRLVKWLTWLGFDILEDVHPNASARIEVSPDHLIEDSDRIVMALAARGILTKPGKAVYAIHQPSLSSFNGVSTIHVTIDDKVFAGGVQDV